MVEEASMPPWVVLLITVLTTLIASSGFWAYMMHKDVVRNSTTQLIMGLTYDRITHLGMKYIERGYITKDEYKDFEQYFFDPYTKLGGNGMADRIMKELSALPFRSSQRAFLDAGKIVPEERE